MAPPVRRSKQNSTSPSTASPLVSLPGIAVGLFAAVAAAFVASRTLRKKRLPQSLPEQEANALAEGKDSTSFTPLVTQDGELEVEDKDDNNSTVIMIACEPANIEDFNPAFELKAVVDAGDKEELSACQDTHGVSVPVDKASMEALQRDISIDPERNDKDEEKEVDDYNDQHDDDDTGVDGDDDRSSTDGELYPVLVGGKLLDYLEEISVSKDIPEIRSISSNSFSDSVSESSAQEVNSAPVRPLTAMEDSGEDLWPLTKPDTVTSTSLISLDVEIDSPRFHSIVSEFEKVFPQKEVGLDEVNFHVDCDVVEDDEKLVFSDKEDKISGEDLEVTKEECQGEILIKVIELDEGDADSARINGKIISATSCAPDDHTNEDKCAINEDNCAINDDKCAENSDFNIEDESAVEPVRINGKVLCNDSSQANDHGGFDGIFTNPTDFKPVEEGASLDFSSSTLCECVAVDTTDKNVVEMGRNVNSSSTGRECVSIMKLEESLNDCMGISIQDVESSGGINFLSDEPLNRDPENGGGDSGKSMSLLHKQSIPLPESLYSQPARTENVPVGEFVWIQAGGVRVLFEGSASRPDGLNPPQQEPPSTNSVPLEEFEEQGALLRGPLTPTCEETILLEESDSTPNEESLENACAVVAESFDTEQVQPWATQEIAEGSDISSNREAEDEVKCQSIGKEDEPSSFQENDDDERIPRPSGSDEESAKDCNGFAGAVITKPKVQEIEEIPRSMEDVIGTIFELKKLADSSDLISFANSDGRDLMQSVVDHNAFEAVMQPKSKVFEYLPLEIGFFCLLVALMSIVLWYHLASQQVQG